MTHKMVYDREAGVNRLVLRDDAIRYQGRHIVPTSEQTKWVSTWDEFTAAGGNACFNESQTEIELRLPEPYKFGCNFMRPQQ